MRHVLEQSGQAALAAILQRNPLLGFDFDGTLAPIVARPDHARISQSVAGKLRRLAARLPVAIVTGRSAVDVLRRLDFEPYCVVGNHGADLGSDGGAEATRVLDGLRQLLEAQATELVHAGVTVEDKELSIALHYRLSPHPAQALALIRDLLRGTGAECRVFSGKMVENVMPAGLPDKGAAMHHLVRRCGAASALFIGDDINDEAVFASAPDDWLTVRIGRDPASRAHYFLDSTAEVGLLLDRLMTHAGA
ncbi:MAG: otsB [Ramlibacter sp.]|jgi:trehalose 6-phosphate phosphatase|nr:otsB [Ramlibacter sp.]